MSEITNHQEQKNKFASTLNLPKTDFPIRSNAGSDDPAMLARWEQEELYAKAFSLNAGKETFILHDGPPYANGHLHLGHAYNKILKDIVTKSQRMLGKHVPVTPGWDCHGLPIEFKVSQEHPGLNSVELKKKCRAYAQHWIEIQRTEFKRLGVVMDWDHPYSTMDYGYEAAVIRAFGEFVAQGYIERKNKTVPWCATCQTVLAAAEIEHQERKDPSIYVTFALDNSVVVRLFPDYTGNKISLLVWTTTPWTLPLNRAVLLRPDTMYALIELHGQHVIVAKDLVERVATTVGAQGTLLAEISAHQLDHTLVHHPFVANLTVPVVLDQSVSLEDGTACVHCAPGCGPEDYNVGLKNNLEIFSPLTPDGKYAVGIQPPELEGMAITDGTIWVLKKLAKYHALFYKTSIRHAYPHCWRCRNGLIFRATKQWFCDLEKHDLKRKTLDAIETITMVPTLSINRLKATLEGRLEWCLSRQRAWGVPIPALVCTHCDTPFITQELVATVADAIAQHGIESWDDMPLATLIAHNSCSFCGTQGSMVKEKDILDVWFESGVSHYAVLVPKKGLSFPADMYLEGKDQHRAWFQSSLLTSMVLENAACMRSIVTHGFTVDDKGRKMSKSLGNGVEPQELIARLGTDGLRLWALSIDGAADAVVSETLLKNVQEVFRKIRNTCRFLLSNLYDYDHSKDAIPGTDIMLLDQYGLEQLCKFNVKVLKGYHDYDFTAVFHALADYTSVELSAFYLDIIKDRLYIEKADSCERRSAQTVCWYMLDTITRLIAPVLSFTAEQLSDHYQKNKSESIHLQQFSALGDIWQLLAEYYAYVNHDLPPEIYSADLRPLFQVDVQRFVSQWDTQWILLKDVRSALLKALEGQREHGIIKHSLDARITLYIDTKHDQLVMLNEFFKALACSGQTREAFFKEFLIVSQVELVEQPKGLAESELHGLWVKVEHAYGDKCPRCWQWEVTSHEEKLCARCQGLV
jgi:isoleucyl-tRNA synthetase